MHGVWNSPQVNKDIHYLELLASFNGLKSFAKQFTNCEILLRIDNTTAIAYINRMGGTKFKKLNQITREIWQWCQAKDILRYFYLCILY